nr:anthocyanidin 3-O-glucosyltransferase 5-like [Ziziphus jujuba var. spinosa]
MGDHGDDDKKAHVVVLASPGMGHVTPLLELAKTLVLHLGFHVSFLAIPAEEASPAQIHLLRSPNLPPDLHVIDLPRAHVSSTLRHDMGVFSRLCVVVREALRFLPPFLNQNSVNALITDPFCLAAFDIFDDDDVSVPTYVFFTSSASLLALTFYLPTLDEIVVGDYSKISDEVRVPGCKPLPVEDLINDVLDRQVLPISNRLPTVAGILLNTWEELEQVTLRSFRETPFFLQIPIPPVYPIGPITKRDPEPAVKSSTSHANLISWLDKQPSCSVVYVSFGSGGTLSAEQTNELARGLELSGQRFVWVARPPAEANASGNFFNAGDEVEDPATYLEQGFRDRTEGVGMVISSWAPQEEVLRHPSIAGFLTHCGWNSLLESIVYGVPMIAWPMYNEQRMNARMLIEMGLAVKPEVGEGKRVVGWSEIEKVVRMIVEGEQGMLIRSRVREFQNSALRAFNNGSLACVANQWKVESGL